MATVPLLATPDVSVALSRPRLRSTALSDYWAITKPEVNFLIALTTAAGFYLGSVPMSSPFPWLTLLHTVLGTGLVASGAAALNQWMERNFDAKMRRTARRAVAAGRIEPVRALTFGTIVSLAGSAYLALAVNTLASLLVVFTLLSYLLLYTPLKRVTPLCTLIGAIPGATPPLIGWAAARGHLDPEAWMLFALVFLWQFPHFMSIAWMYRDDYDRAGYLVLPPGQTRIRFMTFQTVLPLLALFPVTLLPALTGEPGMRYCAGALLLGVGFFCSGVRFALQRSGSTARQLLMASIIYLPALLALMTLAGS